jgi:hypothetical protein
MSNLYIMFTRTIVLVMFFFNLVAPTEAYASDGSRGIDVVRQAAATGTNLTEADSVPDPSFTVAGVTYGFSAGDCDPVTADAQPCTNPIQASVDFLSGVAASSPWLGIGATPDDGSIHIEDGTYTEDISIDGASGWASGANRPAHLGILGAGRGSTFVDGGFAITHMNDLTLSGFSLKDFDVSGNVTSITAHDNIGTLELSDIAVVSIDPGLNPTDHVGDGIYVIDHFGDIRLTDVDASNNSETGAWLDNRVGLGAISIESSNFNANRTGLIAQSNGNIVFAGVSANNNLMAGANASNCSEISLVCTGTGDISISSSLFNNNNQPGVSTSHTPGLVAESNGEIHLSQVTADSNDNDGALLVNYFDGSNSAIRVEQSEFHDNGQGEIGSGLDVRSRGQVSIIDVNSERNLEYGVDVFNGYGGAIADIRVRRGQFNENGLSGIRLGSKGNTDVVGASINGNATLGETINALEVNSSGDITISRVTADDNHGWGARLDNTAGQGLILVDASEFNRNAACGLCAYANGNITFVGVTASYNGSSGSNADNCLGTGLACPGRGRIIVNASEFDNNGPVGVPIPHWVGFVAYSNEDILLTNVSASSNNYHGAVIFNDFEGSTGRIIVRRSEFNNNGLGGELGDGLKPQSRSHISLIDVTASRNLEKGIESFNGFSDSAGEILLSRGQFRDNGWEGLELVSNKLITVSGTLIENNRLMGADLESPLRVIVSCSAVLNHRTHIGIQGVTPLLNLNGVFFVGNGVNYTSTGRVVIRRGC